MQKRWMVRIVINTFNSGLAVCWVDKRHRGSYRLLKDEHTKKSNRGRSVTVDCCVPRFH